MIRFANVSKAYLGGKPALQGLNFHLSVGSMTYLTGHSGAGKSTLLKLIMGTHRVIAWRRRDPRNVAVRPPRPRPVRRRRDGDAPVLGQL